MTVDVDRVVVVVVDALRGDHGEVYREIYPSGAWSTAVAPATLTPVSLASLLSGRAVPEHGVRHFYQGAGAPQRLQRETILHTCDAVSHSIAVDGVGLLGPESHTVGGAFSFAELLGPDWFAGDDPDVPSKYTASTDDVVDSIADHEVTLLHDMVVHGNPHHGDVLGDRLDADTYAGHVRASATAHENLRERLQEAGLWEGTLFVVTADHGTVFPDDYKADATGHGDVAPWPSVAHVPLGVALAGGTVDVEIPSPVGLADVPALVADATPAGVGPDRDDVPAVGGRPWRATKAVGLRERGDVGAHRVAGVSVTDADGRVLVDPGDGDRRTYVKSGSRPSFPGYPPGLAPEDMHANVESFRDKFEWRS